MARTIDEEPDDEDGDDYDAEYDYDPEDPETYPAGLYINDERSLLPCPHCRAEIDEESEQCPKCGMYLSREDAPTERKSPVLVMLMLMLMLLALFAALVMVAGC